MPQALPDHVPARMPPLPGVAARVRGLSGQLAADALRDAIARDPSLGTRYDAVLLRTFLRDYERHLSQLAAALEAGDAGPMTGYVDTVAPLFRRRRVPLEDLATLLLGLLDAVRDVLPPVEADAAALVVEAGVATLRRPRHLAGNRPGNPILRFLWKGAGSLD